MLLLEDIVHESSQLLVTFDQGHFCTTATNLLNFGRTVYYVAVREQNY